MRDADDLHSYLRGQFSDLEGAKAWARAWYEGGQVTPGAGMISCRSMAAHISDAIEGRAPSPGLLTNYLGTAHGPDIYHAMFAGQ